MIRPVPSTVLLVLFSLLVVGCGAGSKQDDRLDAREINRLLDDYQLYSSSNSWDRLADMYSYPATIVVQSPATDEADSISELQSKYTAQKLIEMFLDSDVDIEAMDEITLVSTDLTNVRPSAAYVDGGGYDFDLEIEFVFNSPNPYLVPVFMFGTHPELIYVSKYDTRFSNRVVSGNEVTADFDLITTYRDDSFCQYYKVEAKSKLVFSGQKIARHEQRMSMNNLCH